MVIQDPSPTSETVIWIASIGTVATAVAAICLALLRIRKLRPIYETLKAKIFRVQALKRRIDMLETTIAEMSTKLYSQHSAIMCILDNQNEKLDHLVSEVKLNGGSSIKDMLNNLVLSVCTEEDTRRSMFSSSVAFWEASPDGKFIYVSDKLSEYLGLHPQDAIGHGWVTSILGEDRIRVQRSYQDSVKDQRAFSERFRIHQPSGTVILVAGNCKPVIRNHKLIKFVGMITKIGDN